MGSLPTTLQPQGALAPIILALHGVALSSICLETQVDSSQELLLNFTE